MRVPDELHVKVQEAGHQRVRSSRGANLQSDHLEENYPNLEKVASRMQIDLQDALSRDSFVAGTMFFARFSSLVPILKMGLQAEDFETEAGQLDVNLSFTGDFE